MWRKPWNSGFQAKKILKILFSKFSVALATKSFLEIFFFSFFFFPQTHSQGMRKEERKENFQRNPVFLFLTPSAPLKGSGKSTFRWRNDCSWEVVSSLERLSCKDIKYELTSHQQSLGWRFVREKYLLETNDLQPITVVSLSSCPILIPWSHN